MNRRATLFSFPIFVFSSAISATAEEHRVDSASVFTRYHDKVVQVRVIDTISGTKSVIGSGFFVSPDGLVVTNYHVVAELVRNSERTKAEIIRADSSRWTAELVAIDIVHDLALLKSSDPSPSFIPIMNGEELRNGQRIFAFGNPHDLGLTIVEGTYSGLLDNSLYEKIHFTGSLNPGMSGGPTITAQGNLVGVNVSTAGNQLSFLVPAQLVAAMVAARASRKEIGGKKFFDIARDQLLANQERYLKPLLANPFSRGRLAHCLLPGELVPAFKCWSRSMDNSNTQYEANYQNCSIEDEIYVNENLSTGTIEFEHVVVKSRGLNRFQFYNAYEELAERSSHQKTPAEEEDVTNFQCIERFVEVNDVDFLATFCLRAYKKLIGLYDAVLLAASVNENHRGLITRLTFTGVSWENAQGFAKNYLSAIVCGNSSS